MPNRPSTALAGQVYQSFEATPYGQHLAGNIRYERYNLAGVSIDEWRGMLGPDVNNLEHMQYTTELAAYYVSKSHPETLQPHEMEDLLIAAAIHDQGEFFTGDITASLKTDEDEVEELAKAVEHAKQMMPDLDNLTHARIQRIRTDIVFNRETPLGARFASIERMGYLQTALKAYAHFAYNDTLHDDTRTGLEWLVADVMMNMFDNNMLDVASEDPVIHQFIRNRARAITESMDTISDDVFVHYGDFADAKREKFLAAKQQWQNSVFALAA